ncbi:23S rRNA (guanosine(2251)-2'-O)-methyltransferase RlmB [Paenarthrobacter ureafaciens]|jgi:23S rRNA (guanosine2251-2'-O)-methyltransferase|uniref:23S rRNA (guanosine(2251)-2'-O)-methyltransferase RlmB n=1 Tax=Paenarthrobacter TaxID=1742992 RepID=UPI0014095E1C|nr:MULTISPECIES: 23S rRNA (guanosine(2251)-2'-O)-methyltransferase RlmB [Paenarthrobacter]MCW3768485.1 23S rRNA (guanosine(2251)-2'-O)-methyltransferase RlmB [Paenarthrobacter sp. PAE-2]MCX8456696.1 23S rRNA (guanosine(2251)-2'-O)-methyltransferase RlmB [Paenarthrobacter ureafaciens]MCY0973411.1 23S rRNA (guanosine(2251)-2'-O)-methyltransferase RlmB [Paenarthrobacter ureafaciens]
MANNGNRSVKKKKGPTVGTGGHGRKALEGKGPTPKAEDRVYHKAYKNKQLAERSAAKRGAGPRGVGARRSTGPKGRATEELVTGRNSVVEALRAGIPAKALHVAIRIEMDDRVKESLKIAAERNIPLLEAGKSELDRMTEDAVHQGLVLQIPPYEYEDAYDLAEETVAKWKKGHISNAPLFVALDGITDPRNLGAIIRSVSAFSGHGVIVPERRSVGVTASAWKTSAGAAVRVPVARASNLNNALKQFKEMGIYVLGLDGGGDVSLPDLTVATEPVCIVVGSEGKGLSRLVRENCDQIVSIPIDSAMESLNASMAVGISLYEVSRQRSAN